MTETSEHFLKRKEEEMKSLRTQLAAKSEECVALALAVKELGKVVDAVKNVYSPIGPPDPPNSVFRVFKKYEALSTSPTSPNAKQIVEEFKRECEARVWREAEAFVLDWTGRKRVGGADIELCYAMKDARYAKAATRKEES